MQINDHDPAVSIRYAEQIERAAQIEQCEREKNIVFLGKWGSEPDRLFDILTKGRFSQGRQTEFSQFMGRLIKPKKSRIALSLLAPRTVKTHLSADFIYLRSNIRLFYGLENLTLKCRNPLVGLSQDTISNEIRVREGVRSTKRIKLPPMITSEVGKDGHILEHILKDAIPYPVTSDAGHLALSLMDLYSDNGLRPVSMSKALDLMGLLDRVARAGCLVGLDGSSLARQLHDIFSPVRAEETQLPFGLWHGDLAPENMLLDGDTIYLVDWERGGEGFFARDVVKLFDKMRVVRKPMASQIDAWQSARGGQWLAWHSQFMLGRMSIISRRLADFDQLGDDSPIQYKRSLKNLRIATEQLSFHMNSEVGDFLPA